MRFVILVWPVVMMVLNASGVSAQGFPYKPIRIVTTPAGGGGDFVARLMAPVLAERLGQPIVVDNRNPANYVDIMSKASADGHTLLLAGASVWIVSLLQKTSYDVVRDFVPITMVSQEPNILVVNPSLPVTSVKELIALAKARPGQLNFGYAGTGGSTRLSAELFKSMTGVNIVGINYSSAVAYTTATVSNEVQLAFAGVATAVPLIKAGKLRVLGVSSATPSALAPGVSTLADAGLPGYEWTQMTNIYALAKTPDAAVRRLNMEIVRFLIQPDAKERILNIGQEVIANSPEQATAILKSQIAKVSKIIKDAGITAD